MIRLCLAAWLCAAPSIGPKAPAARPTRNQTPKPSTADADFWKAHIPTIGLDGGGSVDAPPFRWEIRNVLSSVEMPGAVEADGIPVKLEQLVVRGKVADVLGEVLDSFRRQGLYVQPLDQQLTLTAHEQVTALDPARFISYSALARQVDGETCSLILGEANVGAGASRLALGTDFAPRFPGGSEPTRTHGEGLDTLSYEVRAPEAEVVKFYDETLGAAGYQQPQPNVFQREREEIRLRTRRTQGITSVLLSRRPPPPDFSPAP